MGKEILSNAEINNAMATVAKAELDNVVDFAELIASAGDFLPDVTFQSSPYTVLQGNQKDLLLSVPFYIRSWRFSADKVTGNDFVIVYLVTEKNDAYILTDGSTGIFSQLVGIMNDRTEKGHASPVDHLLVANGLRVSEYGLNAENKPAGKDEKVVGQGRTYYLA